MDVEGFAPGDEVFGMTGGVGGVQGSLAEYAAVDARLLAHRPDALTPREAAALPWSPSRPGRDWSTGRRSTPGRRCSFTAAPAESATWPCRSPARGAEVVATASPARLETVERLGATPIDYTTTRVEEYVAEHTGGEGFDIVFDTVGGSVLDNSFTSVRTCTGHVASALGWGAHSIAPLSFRGATYSGVFTLLPLLTGRGGAHHGEIMRHTAALADTGALAPLLDPRRFALGDVADAHAAVESGTTEGKIVIDVG